MLVCLLSHLDLIFLNSGVFLFMLSLWSHIITWRGKGGKDLLKLSMLWPMGILSVGSSSHCVCCSIFFYFVLWTLSFVWHDKISQSHYIFLLCLVTSYFPKKHSCLHLWRWYQKDLDVKACSLLVRFPCFKGLLARTKWSYVYWYLCVYTYL